MRFSVFDANDDFLASVSALSIVEAYRKARAAGIIPRGANSRPGDVYPDSATLRNKSGEIIGSIEVDWDEDEDEDLPRHLRRNPPLPEHMAHDDLDEIVQLLAHRFANEEKPVEVLRRFVRDLAARTATIVIDAKGTDDELEQVADAVVMATVPRAWRPTGWRKL